MIPNSGQFPYTQSNERTGAPMGLSPFLSAPNKDLFLGLQNRAQGMANAGGGGGGKSLTLEDQINLVAEECGAYQEGSGQKQNCLERLRQLTEQSQQAAAAKEAAAKVAKDKDGTPPDPAGTGSQPAAAATSPTSGTTSPSGDELDRLVQQRNTAKTPQEREVFNRRINEILAQRRAKDQAAQDQARRDALAARQGRMNEKAAQDDKDRFARWLQTKRGTSYTDPKDLDAAFNDPAARNEYEAWKKASRMVAQAGPQPADKAAMLAGGAPSAQGIGLVQPGNIQDAVGAQRQVDNARKFVQDQQRFTASDAFRDTEQQVRTARQAMQDAGIDAATQMRLEEMYRNGQVTPAEMLQFIEAAKASAGRAGVTVGGMLGRPGAAAGAMDAFKQDRFNRSSPRDYAEALARGEITAEEYQRLMEASGF